MTAQIGAEEASSVRPVTLLPLAGHGAAPEPRERADAARNRIRLLEAASRLVREVGAEHVTMEAVAAAAQVGKGTVFRRFGDRVGLMTALLDHAEKEFQTAVICGPPPLGPGAPPRERLEEFGVRTIRHTMKYVDLYLQADNCPSRRYQAPARTVRAAHVTDLLRRSGVGGDAELLTQALLAYLDPSFLNFHRNGRCFPAERIEDGWRDLVARVTHRC
ncbi:TetR/AcrR family transcriptional regulator [Streptomyces sp. NBC_01218]|uniref:TetR/AcrR family transcriptional regulator n=1 Tax=unclassified Streptomyces TaxID=2593676 RepID=UPI0023B9FB68|nr:MULTISPECIES: TetR/AcrR family transcriptional regulator [unclassified Streptomyces]WEH38463.1 helix-turn-helix domain containing protein [Streptomyces sp. AM 2-1-1]WSQ50121.1 TetR/AcrR family transcriptional regulator [Streptomyces sp. NBC_01218]